MWTKQVSSTQANLPMKYFPENPQNTSLVSAEPTKYTAVRLSCYMTAFRQEQPHSQPPTPLPHSQSPNSPPQSQPPISPTLKIPSVLIRFATSPCRHFKKYLHSQTLRPAALLMNLRNKAQRYSWKAKWMGSDRGEYGVMWGTRRGSRKWCWGVGEEVGSDGREYEEGGKYSRELKQEVRAF